MPDASLPSYGDIWSAYAVTFNLAPCDYVDDSWLETIPHGDLVRILGADSRLTPSLSRYLLETFELENAFFDDFSAPRSRLALLDAAGLQTLFLHTGIALRDDELRNVIDRAQLARLREALGADAIDFAIKRVPFLGTQPRFDYEPDNQDPRIRLTLIGAAFSLSPRAWQNPAYARRVALKLPHSLANELLASWPDQIPLTDSEDTPSLTRRLIKDFCPEWQFLFA